jgi:Ca2+:H+ antiporter
VARRILWSTLALAPIALIVHYAFHAGATVSFVLSAAALVPLAWLIGEATDHAAQHTGPGIGGFVNASFGNAPELIIALLAINDGLPTVVRGAIAGSVVSNILLVLGAAMIAGGDGKVDTRSLRLQLFAVIAAVGVLVIPSALRWNGGHDTHTLFVVTMPIAVVLLVAYLLITRHNLAIHRDAVREEADPDAWPLRTSLAWLTAATVATAFVSEVLVHSLTKFGHSVGLGEFFIAVVIVAIVGNAAEHGGAIVIARRGNIQLATEIAITSSMQVALFVAPAVALLSWLVGSGLPLAFRPVEIATMAISAVLAAVVVWDGRSRRWEGFALAGAYVLAVIWYGFG